MAVNSHEVELGMTVVASDGKDLGTIARIWYPDGRVEPPDPSEQGLLSLGGIERQGHGKSGFFQIDRPLYIDWYVPFEHVRSIERNRVTLDVTEDDAEHQGWQQKPSM